ncbi:MAG TPA: hypothetical protein VFW10_17580 [Steroidobacteraceae bacterium]|nr:hypothetical protein [Steroidobacteraceae bacterium]
MRIVDGYLGLDVLDQRRVIFDFRAGTLTVTEGILLVPLGSRK